MQTRLRNFFKIVKKSGLSSAVKRTVRYLRPDWILIFSSCDIGKQLPDTTVLPHPVGVVIHKDTEIGENVRIFQNVTIGDREGQIDRSGTPTIGSNVTIYAGATILGDITIEEGAVVGANAVVLQDVDEKSLVVGVPAQEV